MPDNVTLVYLFKSGNHIARVESIDFAREAVKSWAEWRSAIQSPFVLVHTEGAGLRYAMDKNEIEAVYYVEYQLNSAERQARASEEIAKKLGESMSEGEDWKKD